MLKKILLIVGILVVLVIVAVVAMGLWVYKNPLAMYERTTRSGIARAGFERMSMAAPAGSAVAGKTAMSRGVSGAYSLIESAGAPVVASTAVVQITEPMVGDGMVVGGAGVAGA